MLSAEVLHGFTWYKYAVVVTGTPIYVNYNLSVFAARSCGDLNVNRR